ncbi:MAG: patatin-like phospholipase family protein [Acidobacteriota bacterium]
MTGRKGRRRRSQPAGVGLALAGGGPEGAVYELGALRALDEALEGIDLNALDAYVGVSAGAFVASCLANGLTTAQMCRALVKSEPGEHPFVPGTFFTPAVGELARRGASIPRHLADAVSRYLRNPGDLSLVEALTGVSRALPVAVLDNEPVREYVASIFAREGRTDDFRRLPHRLFVIAADLCSGQAVRFGSAGFDDVPISRAVQASTALPGLYPPVEIGGRFYVDGVLLKTLHGSVALEEGVELLIAVNPIVPVDTRGLARAPRGGTPALIEGGLPTVLSQTFRTLIHSRLTLGLRSYEARFDGADVVLFEPPRDDYELFFSNIFSFASRRSVCDRAYRSTLADLRRRRHALEPLFARHGIRMRSEVLDGPRRSVWASVGLEAGPLPTPAVAALDAALDRLESALRDGGRLGPALRRPRSGRSAQREDDGEQE